MIRDVIVALSFIGALLISFNINADVVPTQKIKLSKADQSQIENIACTTPHKLKAEIINGYQYDGVELDTQIKHAYVECKPNSTFMYHDADCSSDSKQCKNQYSLIYYVTSCSLDDKYWKCEKTTPATSVNLFGTAITMYLNDITPEYAYKILSEISTYGSFQGISMSDAIGSRCNISQLKDHETIELSCQQKITVSTWCPQPELTKCPRVVFVTGYPIP